MSFTASALVVSWAAIAVLGFARGRARPAPPARAGPRRSRADGHVRRVDRSCCPASTRARPSRFVDHGCGSCERAVAATAHLVAQGRAVVYWRSEDPGAFAAFVIPLSPYAVVVDDQLRLVAAQPVGGEARLAEVIATMTSLEASPA